MVKSTRLVDYFVVAGYDHSNRGRRVERGGFTCQGTIIQRFPTKDWHDSPFIDGLEHFCQPNGWILRPDKVDPKFFVSVLTDIEGRRHYCACLAFSEAVPKDLIEAAADREAADEEDEDAEEINDVGGVGQPSIVSGRRLASIGRTVRSGSLPRHVVPGISLPANAHEAVFFAPKCLVIVSVHDFPEVFRNCLGVIYTVYSECLVGAGGERIRLETLVGNLLGSVYVPDEGGGPVRFSLGASDKLLLHPPTYPTIPNTGNRVALLFQQLGIHNVLVLLIAALTEHKILFHSQSFSRLTDSCMALVALLYPMRYSHVFIPILPSSLIEVLATPTPFVIGVHSLHAHELSGELLDVIYVDLDGGAIHIPDNLKIPTINETLLAKTQHELSLVLKPDLGVADNAFYDSSSDIVPVGRKPQALLDKELRAVVLRMMVRILEGYRSCLTIVRIHPTPYITFHKAAFLGMRNQSETEFIKRLVNCMFFNTLVSDRGPPWRQCDIFDELYSVFGEQCQVEQTDPSRVLRHIQILAEELYRNENPVATANQPYIQKIPQPAEGAFTRVHQPVFPHLDDEFVQEVVRNGLERRQLEEKSSSTQSGIPMKLVPMGLQLSGNMNGDGNVTLLPNSARRLEVLRNCITSIFENKISDAKKTFPAVIGALKTRQARVALCDELAAHKSGNQVMLDHQQFDMIVRLMNAALQDDSDMDEFGIAATLLPLSTVFGRKLAKGVVQFAYTLIQDHAVWQNQQFWEASFFSDVQTGIKAVYLAMQDQNSNNRSLSTSESPNLPSHSSANHRQRNSNSELSTPNTNRVKESRKSTVCNPAEKSVLELAAEEIRRWSTLTEEVKKDLIMAEEKTVYSQAFDYTNRMINLLCPLELNPRRTGHRRIDDYENASNSISNSVAESDSIDAESGFEDQEIPDAGQHVIKFVLRFADKVCNDSHVTSDHIKAVNQMIPGAVAMHMEMLEAVGAEAKRLPPIQKPKIHLPSLLPGEELVTEHGLRVYLLPDGREEISGSSPTGGGILNRSLALLPAEGALFLTTYRIIFKGNPIDPFAAEHSVTRYFPVSSLTKEKKLSVNEYLTEIEQQLRDGIQLRSNTFQLIRAAFDDEVSIEEVENLRRNIHRIRHPENIFHFFAFRGNHSAQEPSARGKEKQKYGTIRGFASKTLKNVSRAAGIKNKPRKSSKYMLPNMMPAHGRLSIPELTHHESRIREEDEDSQSGDVQAQSSTAGIPLSPSNLVNPSNTKSLERLSERSYFKDWIRLGLIGSDYVLSFAGSKTHQPTDSFRVTTVNYRYSVAPTYPALLVVPANGKVTDEFLKRYCRFHRQARFPTITWKHPTTQGLLLRGSTFHGRGVMGMIRRHQDGGSQGSGGQTDMASSVEAEIYLTSVVQATPRAMIRPDSAWSMTGSELSLNTLVMPGGSGPNSADYPAVHLYPTLTPNMARKFNPITRAVDTLTRNTPAPSKMPRLSLSNLKSQRQMGSQNSLSPGGMGTPSSRTSYRQHDADSSSDAGGINAFLQRTALYIFGDKSQVRNMKLDAHPKAELIPVEFPEPRRIRASFKKLMRACVPSTTSNQPEQTFLKLIESSEWLNHLGTLLQLSGAVVDLLDSQGASVMLCLEDGWDVTSQVSSLAQLCLDPYYRTLEGFRVLIEKEWLAFGHRFNHRSNLFNPNQDWTFTPVFLQFLDAVHQIHVQFPAAFEFNQHYLKFLAYHHVSCRFRTFLCDNEQIYVQAGFLSNDKRNGTRLRDRASILAGSVGNLGSVDHSSDEDTKTATLPSGPTHLGIHVFDYIERQAAKSPMFHNFLYFVDLADPILRPSHRISNLEIWSYYLGEELKHGPSYDIEIVSMDIETEEEYNTSMTESLAGRDCLTAGYDSMARTDLDIFSNHLRDIGILEAELGHLPHRWQFHWKHLEIPPPLPPREPPIPLVQTTPSMYERRHGRMLHKRSTMDLLWRAKMGVSSGHVVASTADVSFASTHRFEKYNYTAPASCDFCNTLVWGPRTGVRCADCGYNCHEKCRENASKTCAAKYKGVARDPTSENLENLAKDPELGDIHRKDQYNFRPSGDENSQIIHQGYLYKQANFRIKGWKQRWFVLDSTKHQLRYYDTREDFQCRGHIDLSEVARVVESTSAPVAPKKSEDRCFFELQTLKRNYVLCADSRPAAQDWISKIQTCLQ